MDAMEEAARVSAAMRAYGGGFVRALGAALELADPANMQRIKSVFPDYWARYLAMSTASGDRAPQAGARSR